MDYTHHTTEKRTNQHLNLNERYYIEQRLRAGDTITAIAKTLGRSRGTIYNELKRGTVEQIKKDKRQWMYCHDAGQYAYEHSRKGSFPRYKLPQSRLFIQWCYERFVKHHWSFDACVGYARKHALFPSDEMVSTKTLYNYLHLNLLKIAAIDCPLIVRRSTRKAKAKDHKKILGRSIDDRPSQINERIEFGHWEVDTVRGLRSGSDEVLVTLLERKTRFYTTLRAPSGRMDDVLASITNWLATLTKDAPIGICKSITADNGSEFANLTVLESLGVSVYFAHPYAAWERGSNERHNGLLRRFIPKGSTIRNITTETLASVMNWCNTLPRKLLRYKTPAEAFHMELELIR